FLRFGPDGGDLGGRSARTNQLDRGVQIIAAALVGIIQRARSGPDGETTVVTGSVPHVRVQDVVVNRITGTKHPVGKDVRVRAAALAGNRVDAFHVLRAEIVQDFRDEADGLVLAHTRLHRLVQ